MGGYAEARRSPLSKPSTGIRYAHRAVNGIRPELQDLAIPIDSVKPHPRNARQGDVGAVIESFREHGQYQPIIVQKQGMKIVVGNHRWKAAKALGWDSIAAQVLDLTDVQAKKMLLVDNRTSDLATYDDAVLVDLLSSLPSLTGTGFDSEDLDRMTQFLDEPFAPSLVIEIQFDNHDQGRVFQQWREADHSRSVGERLTELIKDSYGR